MSAFVDKVRITVKAGNGGCGAVAFHREKYVAAGGPDGGDGGNGGSVILRVDDNLSTLMDFRYKRKYTAPAGMNGEGGRRKGKSGENLVIRVPRGTVVRDAETGGILCPPGDPAAFARAILRLKGSPELCRRMGERNSQTVEKFSTQRVLAELREIYGAEG